MLVDVVRMRHRGVRLPNHALTATPPVRGDLSLKNYRRLNQHGVRTSFIVARLASVEGGLEIPELLDAVFTNMEGDVFTVAGTEVHAMKPYGSSSSFAQTWLCRVVSDATPRPSNPRPAAT